MTSLNGTPIRTETVEAQIEVFVPHGTLNMTMGLGSADVDGIQLEWVQDITCDRVKCWAQRDGKTVVTVELLFKDLMEKMAEVAVKQVKEVDDDQAPEG